MTFKLFAYLVSCIALDPSTTITRCPSTYEQVFNSQQACADSAFIINSQDKSQRTICIKQGK